MILNQRRATFVLIILQIALFLLFGVFVRYEEIEDGDNSVYPLFQDVHVMIFIGFGLLMTFLKKYGYSAIGFNFFLAALLVQWAILCKGFFHLTNFRIPVNVGSLMNADIAVATVLISMGAVLGQTSLIQLVVMGVIEIVVYSSNSYVGQDLLKVADCGASIFVHTFGAYYGMAVSFIVNRFKRKEGVESDRSLEESSYTSDLFATIGTIFLWLYWPSFNAGELVGDDQHRAIINTYLSLAGSCVTAFAISAIFTSDYKFDMVHIQNSTLAGGVAVGAVANMMIQPYGAILIGMAAGALSVVGYRIITPWIDKNLYVHDTCGVHNLHGMPGVLSAIASAIMAAIATKDQYHLGLYDIFPARGVAYPYDDDDAEVYGRSALQQAGFQILALIMTIIVAVVSGLVTGIAMCTIFTPLHRMSTAAEYNDALCWKLPDVEDVPEKPTVQDPESKTTLCNSNLLPREDPENGSV